MCMEGGWLNLALGWGSENVDLWYNIADAINKIGFGLVVYNIAFTETQKRVGIGVFYVRLLEGEGQVR